MLAQQYIGVCGLGNIAPYSLSGLSVAPRENELDDRFSYRGYVRRSTRQAGCESGLCRTVKTRYGFVRLSCTHLLGKASHSMGENMEELKREIEQLKKRIEELERRPQLIPYLPPIITNPPSHLPPPSPLHYHNGNPCFNDPCLWC